MSSGTKETFTNQSAIAYLLDDQNYVKPSASVFKTSLKEVYGDSSWQLFNPLNVLEAAVLIPANAADRACLLGMPKAAAKQSEQGAKDSIILAGAFIPDEQDIPLPVNAPAYTVSKRRKWLRAGVNLLMRVPHKLIQPLSSPKKFFLVPMNRLRQQHPKWFAAVLLSTLLVAIFIAASLFVPGLPGFMLALGVGAAHAGAALAGAAGLGIAIAVVIAKLAIIAFTVVASAKLLQVVAAEAAGLRQYQRDKNKANPRLFDETKSADTAEPLVNGKKNVITIQPQTEQEQAEFDACANTYNKVWEIIRLAYPRFKVKLSLSSQNKALIGYLLEQEIADKNALQHQLDQVLGDVQYRYLTSELIDDGAANDAKPVIIQGYVDKFVEVVESIRNTRSTLYFNYRTAPQGLKPELRSLIQAELERLKSAAKTNSDSQVQPSQVEEKKATSSTLTQQLPLKTGRFR